MGGIRTRLAVTLVLLVAFTVAAIGVGVYAFVEASLRDRLLADARHQADFNLSVLLPAADPPPTDASSFAASGLPDAFKLRGDVDTIADFGDGNPYDAGRPPRVARPASRRTLRALVGEGQLGFAWQTLAGEPVLVVGGRQASAPDLYFVFPAADVEAALAQLRLGLIAGGLLAIARGADHGRVHRPRHPAAGGRGGAGRAPDRRRRPDRARPRAAGATSSGAGRRSSTGWPTTLETTVGRLESAQQQNRRFVADVSHELRTPLTALVAEASLIERALDGMTPDARRAAELLVADVRRLRTLVDELMEISRFDADAERPTLEPIDLGRLVTAIVAARLPGRGRHAARRRRSSIESDPRRLDRILGNLLDNARDHAPDATRRGLADQHARGRRDRGRRPRAGRARARRCPHAVRPVLQGRPVARAAGSSGLGLAIAAEHAALLGGDAAGEGASGRRPDLRAHAARDRIVTRRAMAPTRSRRTLAPHRQSAPRTST